MKATKYTPEIIEFVKENAHKGTKWLVKELNDKYKLDTTVESLHTACKNKKIKIDRVSKYTHDIIDFIRNNAEKGTDWLINELKIQHNIITNKTILGTLCYRNKIKLRRFSGSNRGLNGYVKDFIVENYNNYSFRELAEMINEKFGIETTFERVREYCRSLGLKGYSKQKHLNKKKLPIGTERIHNDAHGRPKIYIRYRDEQIEKNGNARTNEWVVNWMPKTRYVWQQHYGEIPKGYCLIQLDGDYSNCDISNLRMVSTSTFMKLLHYNAHGKSIATEALCDILELEEKINGELK